MIGKIKTLSQAFFDEIVDIRRHLHKYPELSFQEHETSTYIKSVLKKWGIQFIENIADNGIVVVLEGVNPTSRVIGLRADFDALPIKEENDVSYSSFNKGIMHACGHDAHTASLLGTIKILNSLKQHWQGSIKFIFQPAEEVFPGGAQKMIKEGVLNNPNVSAMIAQHVYPELEVGKVGFCPGKYMASADEIHISVIGKGGHAALPATYNNPIIAAAKLITKLHENFIRDIDNSAVLGIGLVNADGYTNVIPDSLIIKGTFRSMDEQYREQAHLKIKKIVNDIKNKYSVDIDLSINKGYPCLVNDIDFTSNLINLSKDFLGGSNVVELQKRMTAEDFSYFSQQLPSCFYRLGVRNEEKGIVHGLHTSRFNIDEDALMIGMGLMAYLAIKS